MSGVQDRRDRVRQVDAAARARPGRGPLALLRARALAGRHQPAHALAAPAGARGGRIVERHTFPEVPPRVEYALTEKGLALLPIIEDMRSYGERWLGADCEDALKPAPGCRADAAPMLQAAAPSGSVLADAARSAVRSLQLPGRPDRVRHSGRRRPAGRHHGRPGGALRARPRAGGGDRTPLYCYRPLTGAFIAERARRQCCPTTRAAATGDYSGFDGLDRYLVAAGANSAAAARARRRAALRALLKDVFRRADRLRAAPRAPARGARAARRPPPAAAGGR